MAENVFSISEIAGTSSESVERAIENAIARARQTIRNLEWFQVEEVRGAIAGDSIEYQVALKVGFKLEA
ncbi:MAG: dodecin family protein [bacterium]|jgi:flavin-binding protein dodecin|nr:dodecin family protein [bacterium]